MFSRQNRECSDTPHQQQGVELDEPCLKKLMCYLGDTSIDVFAMNPGILSYPSVMMECTFLDIFDDRSKDEIEERCLRDGHILWSQLRPIIVANPEVARSPSLSPCWNSPSSGLSDNVHLDHFSLRYRKAQVEQFFAADAALSNVVVMCGEYMQPHTGYHTH
jgi:hypothetical protein